MLPQQMAHKHSLTQAQTRFVLAWDRVLFAQLASYLVWERLNFRAARNKTGCSQSWRSRNSRWRPSELGRCHESFGCRRIYHHDW